MGKIAILAWGIVSLIQTASGQSAVLESSSSQTCLEDVKHLVYQKRIEKSEQRLVSLPKIDVQVDAPLALSLEFIHQFGQSFHATTKLIEHETMRGLWVIKLMEENAGMTGKIVGTEFMVRLKKELIDPTQAALVECQTLMASIDRYAKLLEGYAITRFDNPDELREVLVWQMVMIDQMSTVLQRRYAELVIMEANLQKILPDMTSEQRALFTGTLYGALDPISAVVEASHSFSDRLQVLYLMKGERTLEEFMRMKVVVD